MYRGVLPAQPNPQEVTSKKLAIRIFALTHSCRRSRRRRYHAQDRAAHRKPSVGHRQHAGSYMQSVHLPLRP